MKAYLAATAATAALCLAFPALAHDPAEHGEAAAVQDQHAGHDMPAAEQPSQADPHAGHDMPAEQPVETDPHAGHETPAAETDPHAGHAGMASIGVLGSYAPGRDASGTSWNPDVSAHGGVHSRLGGWMVMSHLTLNGVYSWQEGPRGDEDVFVSGMVMAAARRDLSNMGTVNLRAMLSPDPFMGKDGYPLLLAAGETADGVHPLVDRQHPHDLFMELSASYTHRFSDSDSVFLYAGLPGEPAFGPPAFMHRLSAMDSPEAPITHHWLDSTHITFGVVTAGWVHDRWKVEVSRFKGREPDEDRFDIESPRLDSSSARVTFNPTDNWSLQASWADIESPEALEPDEDEERVSASAIYTVPFGDGGWWSSTLAWSRKFKEHEELDAWALETAVKPNAAWTVFARAEQIDTDELTPGGHGGHGHVETVAKVSLGVIRDFRITDSVTFGVGGLYTLNRVPTSLEPGYGGDPDGAMAFVRLKVGG